MIEIYKILNREISKLNNTGVYFYQRKSLNI